MDLWIESLVKESYEDKMDAELIIELIKIIQFEENNKTNATLRKKIEERDSDE